MNKILITALAGYMLASCGDARALGAVSRACQFSTIPIALQPVAVGFFQAAGGPLWLLDLPFYSDSEKRQHFILEALTTDYVEARYYLYAHAHVYRRYRISQGSVNAGEWGWFKSYASNGWGASRVNRALLSDSRFSIYLANRGPFYSVRAGNASIVEKLDISAYASAYVVKGGHHYYDPVTKRSVEMPETRATDCNLGNFGQENKGIFDW